MDENVTPEAKPEATLDDLLNEFSKAETPAEQPKVEAPKVDPVEEVHKLRSEINAERTKADVVKTVESIRESHKDSLGWMTSDWIEGRLDAEARKDPRIAKAFVERGSNPEAWQKIVQRLGEKLESEIKSRPNPQLTADRDAARAAVSGQTVTQPSDKPDPDKFKNMNFRQLAEYANSKRRA